MGWNRNDQSEEQIFHSKKIIIEKCLNKKFVYEIDLPKEKIL